MHAQDAGVGDEHLGRMAAYLPPVDDGGHLQRSEVPEHPQPHERVHRAAEESLLLRSYPAQRLRARSQNDLVDEPAAVHFHRIDAADVVLSHDQVERARDRERDAELAGEHVGGACRHDSHGYVLPGQQAGHSSYGAIAPHGDDVRGALVYRLLHRALDVLATMEHQYLAAATAGDLLHSPHGIMPGAHSRTGIYYEEREPADHPSITEWRRDLVIPGDLTRSHERIHVVLRLTVSDQSRLRSISTTLHQDRDLHNL